MLHDEDSQPDRSAERSTTRISMYRRESLVDARDRDGLRELLGGANDAAFFVDARPLLAEEGRAALSMTDADVLATIEAMLVSGELFLVRGDPILTVPEIP